MRSLLELITLLLGSAFIIATIIYPFAVALLLGLRTPLSQIKIRLVLATYDAWFGVYWKSETRTVYYFPIPFVGFKLWREEPHA